MDEKWGRLTEIEQPIPNELNAIVEVKEDSPWFSGHFPGQPILPAIAMIAFVWEAIELFGKKIEIQFLPKEYRRVRFRQLIRPPQKISIRVRYDRERSGFHFSINSENGLVAGGVILVEQS